MNVHEYEALAPFYDKFFFPYGSNAHFRFPLLGSSVGTALGSSSSQASSQSPAQRTRSLSLSSRKTEELRRERKQSVVDIFKRHEVRTLLDNLRLSAPPD